MKRGLAYLFSVLCAEISFSLLGIGAFSSAFLLRSVSKTRRFS